jgi:hypothetical protein
MVRPFVGILGAFTALFPDAMIEAFEAGFIENPDECTRKPLGRSGVRAEGILVLAAGLAGGRAYAWLMGATGFFGAVVLLYPRLYRRLATALLYEETDTVEWTDRYATIVRAIGFAYLVLAVRELKTRLVDE